MVDHQVRKSADTPAELRPQNLTEDSEKYATTYSKTPWHLLNIFVLTKVGFCKHFGKLLYTYRTFQETRV